MATSRKNGRDTAGRFARGNSGRPKGARNRATIAVQELLDGEAETLTRKAVELALDGDTTALRLCLERIAPPRKSQFVSLEMPEVNTASDIVAALSAIVGAVARGELSPDEGEAVATLVERHRRAIETAELENRIVRLEKSLDGDGREV